MRALVWIIEDTWEATVAAAAALLPAQAEVTLLHASSPVGEALVREGRRGLLGRAVRRQEDAGLQELAESAAAELLAQARARLGRDAALVSARGRVEREVVAAAEGMDLLVLARDGDRSRLGPRSLGPATRFVVDHAPCGVLLVWPQEAPGVATMPPPPGRGHP
jgi:nucleotide-binding universal stress UspA family protein